jgi:hypothetical protein
MYATKEVKERHVEVLSRTGDRTERSNILKKA